MNNTKYVVKRNGSKAPFQVQKLKDMINFACDGLDVNPLELESKISLSMKNNIKTSEIQELMTHTCLTLISPEEPDWVYVSGRLDMANLHGEVLKTSGFKYSEFNDFFKYAVRNNYYRKNITNSYSEDDMIELSKLIIPSKDFNKNIAQVASLKSKYLIKNKTGILEYPQFADLTSSMILASVENDKNKWTKEFFEMIVDDYISLATPFKSNLRLENGNTGSCFILPIGDSLSQISKGWTDISIISREGGGIGAYLGYIRPGGTYSKSVFKSNKINRWVKIINDIAVAVNQRSIRPGAITPALDWWHLDIEDFIEMKAETGGDLRDKCFDLFPQIVFDAYFVDAVLENREVYLFNHYELKELIGIDVISQVDDELYNTHKLVEQLIDEGKLKHYHKIVAKDLWKNALRIWIETGDFYLTHKDNLNICNYLKGNSFIANSANLCVSGDTKILTKDYGYIEINKVAGKSLECWNGSKWSLTELFKTSDSDTLTTVELSHGLSINATENHRWLIVDGYSKKGQPAKLKEVRTKDLKIGDKLAKFDLPIVEHGNKVLELAYENGFFTGDGCGEANKIGRIYLYDKKRKLLESFEGYTSFHHDENQNRTVLSYGNRNLKEKFFIPDLSYTVGTRLQWLAGLFDSDGTLTNNNNTEGIQFTSTNKSFLEQILLLLQEMGVQSKVRILRESGEYMLPANDGTGTNKLFECSAVYRLLICGSALQKLLDLGYIGRRVHPTRREQNRESIHFIKVENIHPNNVPQPTYCGNEPLNHTLMFNGVMTMNCVESFSISKLPTQWKIEGSVDKQNTIESDGIYHSCNLVSINVGIIFNDKLLKRVCGNAVRILDNSIETGTMPVLEAQTSAEWLRNVGIGIVGGADWMAYNKLSYEKEEDVTKYEALIEKISYYCYEASINLAVEKGSYPAYKQANYDTMFGKTPQELNKLSPNGFDWVALNNRIKTEGIRNFLLLAIAPNTSTGILMGAIANYLPPQDKFSIQTLANLSVPIIPRYLKTRFWYYKSKFNYKPEILINVTKRLQRWIDTGISMEVAINTNIANMKDISDAILSGFKNKELKAVYYSLTINGEKAGCSDCAN